MSQNIDWHFWKAMRTVKLWQSCALVAGLDPDALKPHPQAWMAGPGSCPLFKAKSFPNQDMKAKFEKILRLAEPAVSYMTGPIFPKGQLHPGSAGTKEVLLSDVVAFFVSVHWPEIPEALQSLSSQPIASATESKEVKTPLLVIPASVAPVVSVFVEKPWLEIDPRDPEPKQPWFTPARYFARQLAIENATLLANRTLLADKVSAALFNAGYKKRGGKKKFDSGTVLKAFANVTLG